MEVKRKGGLTQSTKKVSLVMGTILISLGFIFLMQFDVIHDYIIKTAMTFEPGSETYKSWITNDPPYIINFYLFNWTNAEECLVHLNCSKFKFKEVGPYPFYEVKQKVNIKWHPNNTVSFKYMKKYYYANDVNNATRLTDKITTVNPIPLALAYKMRHKNFFAKISASVGLFSMTKLMTTRTVAEFLFDGYGDHILSTGSLVDASIPEKFGYFYKKNYTVNENEMLMHHGFDEDFGKLLLLNGRNTTHYYPGYCGEVRGSSGEFLPINAQQSYIDIYSSELCSYARLEYEKNVTVKGIHSYKYGSRILFDNGTLDPQNACFCQGECIPTGVQNVSTCKQHSPIFLSLPHFYNSDPYYLSRLEGLHPDKDKHEIYISVEPKSSIVLDLGLRMQINILLQPIKNLVMFERVPKLMVPLFYFDQRITLSDEILDRINMVASLPELAKVWSVGIIIIGGVMIGVAILLFVFVRVEKEDKLELKKMSSL